MTEMQNQLLALAAEALPEVIAAFKARFRAKNAATPDPTNEEIMAAFETAFEQSRAIDDKWLRDHE